MVRSGPPRCRPRPTRPGTPTTRRWSSTTIRPRSSTGSPPMPASGDGFTPAVQTSVSAANACPSDNRIVPSSADVEPRVQQDVDVAFRQLVPARRPRESARKLGQDLPGRPRPGPTASRTGAASGSCASRRGRGPPSSPSASTPAYPAPTNTNVSAARRRVGSVGLRWRRPAAKHVVPQVDRLLHRLEPDPVLGQPGDGQHARPRTRPSRRARRSSSAHWSRRRGSAPSTLRASWSIDVTSPTSIVARFSNGRSGTTMARGSIVPLTRPRAGTAGTA